MRLGLLLAFLTSACADDPITLSVRLSLAEAARCMDTMTTTMVDGPEDIPLPCGAWAGLFVLGTPDGSPLGSTCGIIEAADTTSPSTDATLADVPAALAGFRSPELDAGTRITVLLQVDSGDPANRMGQCVPASDPGGTAADVEISGSQDLTVGATDVIDVALTCNAVPCPTM